MDINEWKKTVLLPVAYDQLDILNPQMEWRWRGRGWQSPKKADGSAPQQKKNDKCVCYRPTEGKDYGIFEQGEEGPVIFLFDHLCKQLGLTGDFISQAKQLANLVEVEHPFSSYSQNKKATVTFSKFCDAITQAYQNAPEDSDVKKYLQSRGWSKNEIYQAPFGYVESREWLKSFLGEDFNKFGETHGLMGGWWADSHKLIFIWRTKTGLPYRITMRDITGKFEKTEKTLNTKGESSKWVAPYLSETLEPDNNDQIHTYLVEGEIDAARCCVNGFTAVATGGTSRAGRSGKVVHYLISAGIDGITVVGDNDKAQEKKSSAGRDACTSFARELTQHNLFSYIILCPGGSPEKCLKDVDDVFSDGGKDAFTALLETKVSPGTWLAQEVFTGWEGSPEQALVKTRKEIKHFYNLRYPEHGDDFARKASEVTGTDWETLKKSLNALRQDEEHRARLERDVAEREEQRKRDEITANRIKEIFEGIASARIERSEGLREATKQLKRLEATQDLKRKSWTLNDILEEKNSRPPYFSTGYRAFENKSVRLYPSAITLFAARTHHGKTTLLINLLRRQMEMNEYKDIPRDVKHIPHRWLFLAWEYDVVDFYEKLRKCLMAAGTTTENTVDDVIGRWLEEEWIILPRVERDGTPRNVDKISDLIKYYSSKYSEEHYGKLGGVFVDYTQQVRATEGSKASAAYLDMKQVTEELIDAATDTSTAIVGAVQLNRDAVRGSKIEDGITLHNIRESGDLEQIAHTVVGIYSTQQAIRDRSNKEGTKDNKLAFTVLKNRKGKPSDWSYDLTFDGENGFIDEA